MTDTITVTNVPPGRKVRAVLFCPDWCSKCTAKDDGLGGSHYSDSLLDMATDPPPPLDAWLLADDDRVDDTVTVHLDIPGHPVEWTVAEVKAQIAGLQRLLRIAGVANPDDDRVPAATLALSLARRSWGPREQLDTMKILDLLEGRAEVVDVVDTDLLGEWIDVCNQIDVLRAKVEAVEGNLEKTKVVFGRLMEVEQERRTLLNGAASRRVGGGQQHDVGTAT